MLVTGGGRGIGAAIARGAAEEGYAVCVNYLNNKEAADSVADFIINQGGQAVAIQADVAVEQDVIRLFEQLDSALGCITALVNNAGILEKQARVEDLDAARLSRVITTNVIGSFMCSREAVRRMSTRRGGQGGTIVNLSSTGVKLGNPNQWVHYAASKGAVDVFTGGLAREVAEEGIRVNAVSPGLTLRDPAEEAQTLARLETLRHEIPMARPGTVQEIAATVFWLCSAEASYITGAVIPVAGGR